MPSTSASFTGSISAKELIITAAHVVPADPKVQIGDLDLPAKVIKVSPLEQFDLALLSVDDSKLPISLRLRRMPLCQGRPVVGSAVVVAIPEGTARSWILTPALAAVPRALTVLDRDQPCQERPEIRVPGCSMSKSIACSGVMSRKIVQRSPSGESSMDVAKYFVPSG